MTFKDIQIGCILVPKEYVTGGFWLLISKSSNHEAVFVNLESCQRYRNVDEDDYEFEHHEII